MVTIEQSVTSVELIPLPQCPSNNVTMLGFHSTDTIEVRVTNTVVMRFLPLITAADGSNNTYQGGEL